MMSTQAINNHIAEYCLKRLADGAEISEVVDETKTKLGEPADALEPLWEKIGKLAVAETERDSFRSTELLLRVYHFILALGVAYDWRKGVVDGAHGLSHLLIDVNREHEQALVELGSIEEHLFDADPSAWAGIKGDMGIAMLWLGRHKEAIAFLSVPCALAGVLVPTETAALYRGNLGVALAKEGLFDQARACLKDAIGSVTEDELREKFTADLRQLDQVQKENGFVPNSSTYK